MLNTYSVVWNLGDEGDRFSDEVEAIDALNAVVELTNELVGEHGTAILDELVIHDVELAGQDNDGGHEARVYAQLCHLAEALWHHVELPDDPADLFPGTSKEARQAASMMLRIVRSKPVEK